MCLWLFLFISIYLYILADLDVPLLQAVAGERAWASQSSPVSRSHCVLDPQPGLHWTSQLTLCTCSAHSANRSIYTGGNVKHLRSRWSKWWSRGYLQWAPMSSCSLDPSFPIMQLYSLFHQTLQDWHMLVSFKPHTSGLLVFTIFFYWVQGKWLTRKHLGQYKREKQQNQTITLKRNTKSLKKK